MKVYCYDCKYFQGNPIRYMCKDLWACKKEKYLTPDPHRKRYAYHKNTYIKNQNNNCKDYQRKWWKFWAGR